MAGFGSRSAAVLLIDPKFPHKAYRRVHVGHVRDQAGAIEEVIAQTGMATPVAVEVRRASEDLCDFIHPENAIYVFGPEDSSLGRAILTQCHRFVRIPSEGCLNLAAAVNVVLYDRIAKERVPTVL